MSTEAADTAEQNPILALMKFGAAADLQDLLTRGHLFMQTASHFAALEAGPLRGDRDEALTYCYQPTRTVLEVRAHGDWLKVGGIVGPIRYREDNESAGNVFCMFALRASHAEAYADHAEPLVDERNQAFGDSAVVVINRDEFLCRARAAAERNGLTLRGGPVQYVDELSYHGRMGPFRKFSAYSYQSEYRLLAEPGCIGPRSLVLGSLDDIAVLLSLAEINHMLRVRSDDGTGRAPS